MAFAKLKLPIILFGAAQLLKHAARRQSGIQGAGEGAQSRRADHGPRRGDRALVRVQGRRDHTGAGLHAKPDIKLMFKNAEVGAALLMPPINWLDQINAQKDFNLTVDGPKKLTNWFAQTLMLSQSAGLKYGTKMRARRHALLQHDQWRAGFRRRQGRQDHPHDADRSHRRGRRLVDHRGQRPEAHAAAQDDAGAARPECQVDRLFAGPPALSDEARRFRSERRAQSAKPRQVRLCAHLLGRGDQDRHRRDQAAEARIRPRRHHVLARLASHLGQYRLLPLGAVPLRQCGRHDAHPPQSRFVGRLVLGRGASLGLYAARRPVGDLRHRRGLSAELRHDRVLGGRSGNRPQAPTARRKAPRAGNG